MIEGDVTHQPTLPHYGLPRLLRCKQALT